MIKKAIILGITHGTVKPEELYGLDDEEFFQLFSHKKEPYFQLMSQTTSRTLYKSVFEESFDKTRGSHGELSDLSVKMKREAEIAELISRETGRPVTEDQVIIDIPEPISFEIDLPILIRNGFTQYRNAGSVFTEPVITGFQDSIRKLRLIVPPELSGIPVPWGELFP